MRKLEGEKGNGAGQYFFKETLKTLGYVFVALALCFFFTL